MATRPNYLEQLRKIQTAPPQPVYLITGQEDYLRETAINLLVKRSDTDETTKFFGDEIDADVLNVHLASYSLFTEKKIIIIRYFFIKFIV